MNFHDLCILNVIKNQFNYSLAISNRRGLSSTSACWPGNLFHSLRFAGNFLRLGARFSVRYLLCCASLYAFIYLCPSALNQKPKLIFVAALFTFFISVGGMGGGAGSVFPTHICFLRVAAGQQFGFNPNTRPCFHGKCWLVASRPLNTSHFFPWEVWVAGVQ